MIKLVLSCAFAFLLLAPSTLAVAGDEASSGGSNRISIDWTQDDSDPDEAHRNLMAELGVDDGHPRVVVMPAIVVPLVVDNRLRGYAYIHSRLLIAEGQNSSEIFERTHYALDHLVRASHRHNLTAETGDTVDIELTREVWMQALADYFGEGVIDRMGIMPPDTRLIQ